MHVGILIPEHASVANCLWKHDHKGGLVWYLIIAKPLTLWWVLLFYKYANCLPELFDVLFQNHSRFRLPWQRGAWSWWGGTTAIHSPSPSPLRMMCSPNVATKRRCGETPWRNLVWALSSVSGCQPKCTCTCSSPLVHFSGY